MLQYKSSVRGTCDKQIRCRGIGVSPMIRGLRRTGKHGFHAAAAGHNERNGSQEYGRAEFSVAHEFLRVAVRPLPLAQPSANHCTSERGYTHILNRGPGEVPYPVDLL